MAFAPRERPFCGGLPPYLSNMTQRLVQSALFPLLLMTLMLAPIHRVGAQENVQDQGEKFNTLLYYMNRMYVDTVDLDGLVETAIRGMLEELDPHSVYIPAEDLQQADEPLNGNFEGIGVRFNIMKDTIMVVSTIAGGPSEKLGIMSGDRIVEVDGEIVAGIGIRNKGVMERLKAPRERMWRSASSADAFPSSCASTSSATRFPSTAWMPTTWWMTASGTSRSTGSPRRPWES